MPPIWQAQRTATVAFAPSGPYLATGSFSGAVDASFSTDSTLQVINFASSCWRRLDTGAMPVYAVTAALVLTGFTRQA